LFHKIVLTLLHLLANSVTEPAGTDSKQVPAAFVWRLRFGSVFCFVHFTKCHVMKSVRKINVKMCN